VSGDPFPAFAAADWGTTRLRLWLMDSEGRVLAERRSDEGMLVAAAAGFPQILERHLAAIGAAATLPVIICGMAGARQGWIEAPYVFAPASFREILGRSIAVPHEGRTVRIVPGVAQAENDAPDVMRGEETQLAGAISSLQGRTLVCMPGTHSKWVEAEAGEVKRFSTWLTGELFALLASSSILRHAIEADATISPDGAVFRDWLRQALADPGQMTAMLFRIRAAGLLQGLAQADAAAALSGLLIGCEVGSACRRFAAGSENVLLIASGPLGGLYAAALDEAGFDVTHQDAEEAVRTGLFEAGRRNFLNGGKEGPQ
jgi:2-dehydro-3-deoxygalactonokinase